PLSECEMQGKQFLGIAALGQPTGLGFGCDVQEADRYSAGIGCRRRGDHFACGHWVTAEHQMSATGSYVRCTSGGDFSHLLTPLDCDIFCWPEVFELDGLEISIQAGCEQLSYGGFSGST